MRSIKILLLIFQKYTKRYLTLLVLIVLILGVSFLLFPYIKGVLLINSLSQGIVGTHTENDLPSAVINLISEGLVKVDKSGMPQPNLVKGWEASKDAKEYTFKLKEELYWSDGSKVKASDLAISIPDVEVKIPDDSTIKFKLADSFAPLPTLLAKPVLKKDSRLGIGPYFIESLSKDKIFIKKIVLKSNDKNLPKIIIRFYPNEKIAKNALRLGEVQSLINVSDPDDLIDEKPFALWSKTNYQRLVAIFYNTKDATLSDRNFRIGLSYAAPLIKGETEAKTSISPLSFAFNEDVKDYLNNPKEAEEYLSKVEKEKKITLTVTSNLKKIGEAIVNEWNRRGITALLRVESGIPQNFQALLISQNIPGDPDQYSLWHSTQTKTNISSYSSPNQYSPRVDKDLEEGRKSVNQSLRKERYLDFQKVLLDDAPATFLYFPKLNVVYLKKKHELMERVLKLQYPELI